MKLRRSWMALAASRIRLSSSSMVLRYSSTTSTGRSRPLWGTKRATRRARACIRRRSASMTGSISGRITLMTISRPFSFNRAVCTWAMEADASGVSSKSSNRASTGATQALFYLATGGLTTEGRHPVLQQGQLFGNVGGSRSRQVESIWPNLMKMGPQGLEGKGECRRHGSCLVACS